MLGELITGAANLIGGIFGANATADAADKAAKIQRETNAMTLNLANTAHQREVRDLKAAGLNPLLSGTGGQGASTPTLQAPTQGAEGHAKAGAQISNAIQTLPAAIMQYMTGQQQIEMQKANADKIREETNNIRETGRWIAPTSQMHIDEAKQRVTESTQRTLESQARTATIELMRNPQFEKIVADVAQTAQQTRTEEQRTREALAAADNAKKLYGARAAEAETLASQAAQYYLNYFHPNERQKIDKQDLEIDLLNNQNFQQALKNILDSEYGSIERWSDLFANPIKGTAAGSFIANNKIKITPQSKFTPHRYKGREWKK